MLRPKSCRPGGLWTIACCCLGWIGVAGRPILADPPAPVSAPPSTLNLEDAVAWALQNNPELAALRQQHGIASAAVVIANTYPFNPTWTNKLFGDNGPPAAGITNRVAMEQRVDLQLELHHQRQYRRQAACAALTRSDWEIAFQEENLALRVIRAFDAVLYYDAKLRLADETVRLNESTVDKVRRLMQGGTAKASDLILAQSEVDSSRALLGPARGFRARAGADLRRALGVTEDTYKVQGNLASPLSPPGEPQTPVATALERRPDLHARQAAITEADARVRLAVADRLGNPTIGPDFEYNETSVYFIGAQIVMPLPLLNRHRGDILQREAERNRAGLDLRNNEVTIQQEVGAALERLRNANAWAETYRKEVLPNLEKRLKEMEDLFTLSGGTVLSVIDIQRRLLRARDGYLDVLYELSQAQADLAYAVGDPGLAIVP
jgi:cobalt-zinc-cadmium efflux system outer membrane protein